MKKNTIFNAGLLVLLASLFACGSNTTSNVVTTSNNPTSTATSSITTTTSVANNTSSTSSTKPSSTSSTKPSSTSSTKPSSTTSTTPSTSTSTKPSSTSTSQTQSSVVPVVNSIKGTIVDNANAPVENALVYLNVSNVTINVATTDASGSFAFTDVSAATYSLILVPPSDAYEYKGEKISFTYTSGELVLDEIVLDKTNMNWGALS